MTRSIMVGEVRTGRRITQIPVADASWSMVHRGVGEVSVDIPLGASDFARFERQIIEGLWPSPILYPSPGLYPTHNSGVWRAGDGLRAEFLAALTPGRCFLAALEGDTVLEAGPIWAHDYDHGSSMLKVKAAGLRSLFDHRVVMGVVASGAAAAEWSGTYSALSLATIAKRLIELAMSHTGGELPIVLPDDETAAADADHTRTYYGYDLGRLGDRIDALMGVIDGPDIALQPRLTADRMGIEWVMRAGTEAEPLLSQAGGDHVFDSRVPRGGVGGISVSRDASGLASRAWESGEGMERSRVIEFAADTSPLDNGFPLLESVGSHSTVSERSTLQAWASSDLRSSLRPWMSWSFTAQTNHPGTPKLGAYRPGDWCKVWVSAGHNYLSLLLPEGYHRARVMQVTGDMSDTVKITLAPQREIR